MFDPNVLPERPDMSSVQRLRFLTSLDFPPFNFPDATRRPTGFNVDLARAICETLEIEARCEIQALPWEDLQEALESRQGDAIIAGHAITAEARSELALTRAYFRFPARFVAKRTETVVEADFLTRVSDQVVAVERGTAHAEMLTTHFPDVVPMLVDDQQSAYEAIKTGPADFLFGDGVSLSFFLSSPASENCCTFAGGPYMDSQYIGNGMAIALRPDDDLLLQAIEHALSALERDGTYGEIFTRYFPVSPYAEEEGF